MSHTINCQYVHFIWSTKNLEPILINNLESPLLNYLSGILKKMGGRALATSETHNHIHLLAQVPTDLSISEIVRQIKCCTSKWYRGSNFSSSTFSWNEGYSAFTVSPNSIGRIKQYLFDEKNRHDDIPFEEELTRFLKYQEVKYNPTYLTNSTYTKLYYHLVWSVKNRSSLLKKFFQILLHHCIEKELENNAAKLHAVGNVEDHIHLLVECSAKISTANLVQKLKTKTSYFIKSQSKMFDCFSWQVGYGVFSVGRPALESVLSYVNNQEEHHRIKTFEEEWCMLKKFDQSFLSS